MRINDKENYECIKNSITMKNLKKIIDSKDYLIGKVAINSRISDSTVKAYMNGQKIPSLPTLISIADYLNCNLDYLIDRTNNPIKINDLETLNKNKDINQLMHNILELPKNKQDLVDAYVKGLLAK